MASNLISDVGLGLHIHVIVIRTFLFRAVPLLGDLPLPLELC